METEIDMMDVKEMEEEELISKEDMGMREKLITELQDIQEERLEELNCAELREVLGEFKNAKST